MNSKIYSQKLILTPKGDTLISFTTEQGRYLLKQIYTVYHINALLDACEIQRINCDTIIKEHELKSNYYKKIILNNNSVINLKDNQIGIIQLEVKELRKSFKRQKFYKSVSIIGGSLLSGFLAYKYVTK